MSQYKVLEDICESIFKDDIVEIISSYGYMIGTDIRIKDYFELKTGEVVVKKISKMTSSKSIKEKMAFSKCKMEKLEIIK